MTEKAAVYGVALLVVCLALLAMGGLHERHYKNRRNQLLEARLQALEKIIMGEHE